LRALAKKIPRKKVTTARSQLIFGVLTPKISELFPNWGWDLAKNKPKKSEV